MWKQDRREPQRSWKLTRGSTKRWLKPQKKERIHQCRLSVKSSKCILFKKKKSNFISFHFTSTGRACSPEGRHVCERCYSATYRWHGASARDTEPGHSRGRDSEFSQLEFTVAKVHTVATKKKKVHTTHRACFKTTQKKNPNSLHYETPGWWLSGGVKNNNNKKRLNFNGKTTAWESGGKTRKVAVWFPSAWR